MKRFRISWRERHSEYVFAKNVDEAIELALKKNMAESCDYQMVGEIKEVEPAEVGDGKST